jgi:hypothetical protein
MHPFGSSDNWSWSSDAFPPLWFCVRSLIYDGLRVAPFDQHPDGDGRLRALGLDAEAWHAWVAGVLRQHEQIGEFAQAMRPNQPPSEAERQRVLAAAKVLTRPGSFCPGSDELKEELNDLFVPLYQNGEDWKARIFSAMPTLHGTGGQGRNLWQALEPFHDRLPRFEVFLVEYPVPAVMTMPPSTGIIAPAHDAAGYSRQVVAAASELAAAG